MIRIIHHPEKSTPLDNIGKIHLCSNQIDHQRNLYEEKSHRFTCNNNGLYLQRV